MSQRITGLETEYGCLVLPPAHPQEVMPRIRDWLFENDRYGLIDRHDRDWDEPAGNGGFLFNGGRVYIDMGHMEYCTPECASTLDVVRYDRAGDLLLLEAVQALGLEESVSFIRNNIDHYTGATFGCHENYSLSRRAPLSERNVLSLLAFLTTRVLFSGAGRVGAARSAHAAYHEERDPPRKRDEPHFQISQRADYIQNDFFEWVQHNRAIINTRDEPLADPALFRRLHLIHGDSNVLPASLYLKIGTTRLVLDLLEINALPDVVLMDAVTSLRHLSRTLDPPWSVELLEGMHMDALEVLELFRSRAKSLFQGRDPETDHLLSFWKEVLEMLGGAKDSLVGLLDWVTKEHLMRAFCDQENLAWDHPWLDSQDLEFHHIDPRRGLGLAVANVDGLWNPAELEKALIQPPANSRAHARSKLMREIQGRDISYYLDWEAVEMGDRPRTLLSNPFQP